MLNDDLIAFLQPAPTPFDSFELRDCCQCVTDLEVISHRLTFRADLPPGLYRGRMETFPGKFDPTTAMRPMMQVPEGKRVLVGPWDLDHCNNVMAIPSAKAWCNGRLLGLLWFNMPGPEQIAEGRISADFGFETDEKGKVEFTLEIPEKDRSHFAWSAVKSLELRRDNRRLIPITPIPGSRPCIYFSEEELPVLREAALKNPLVDLGRRYLKDGTMPWIYGHDCGRATHDLGSLIWLLTGDAEIGEEARRLAVEDCAKPTWSGRPDPLLMGGDNDRHIAGHLYSAAIAWKWLKPLLSESDRSIIMEKVAHYLQVMYDFTVLQRGYMGQASPDPHTLGAYSGIGIACMAFYDDLPVARRILPFFHGLLSGSLALFPPGGKAAWVTFFPSYMVRYLAAAYVFGGTRPELADSPFLDHFGDALLASFLNPNSQELHRGTRAVEHRVMASFLDRFWPSPSSASTYWAFVNDEEKKNGDLRPTIFDILYAPKERTEPAPFPKRPFYAHDVGQVILSFPEPSPLGLSLTCGNEAGARASFSLESHNREFSASLASLEISWKGQPLLCSVSIGAYGRSLINHNTMSFVEGGGRVDGQYLAGEVAPEHSASLRRVAITDEIVYLDALLTPGLQEKLKLRYAQRIVLVDLRNDRILVKDRFATDGQPLTLRTHLHALGSITKLKSDLYRLTGGQTSTLAGIKFGKLTDLSDDDFGEIFVSVLESSIKTSVSIEEASWCPAYIYGLNNTGKERLEDAHYPHYRRWQLRATTPAPAGELQYVLSARQEKISNEKGAIGFENGLRVRFDAGDGLSVLGFTLHAESVIWNEAEGWLVAAGLKHLLGDRGEIAFKMPVDLRARLDGAGLSGTIYSSNPAPIASFRGARIEPAQPTATDRNTNASWKMNVTL